jgi:hypothetical protein
MNYCMVMHHIRVILIYIVGKTEAEKCANITRGAPIVYEPFISAEVKTLINGILRHRISERMSMQAIFEHSWMVRQSRLYNIDIKSYIYNVDRTRSDRSNSP